MASISVEPLSALDSADAVDSTGDKETTIKVPQTTFMAVL